MRKAKSLRRGKDDRADQADGKAGNRCCPDRAGKATAAKVEDRQRQPREEDKAKRDVVADLPGRKRHVRKLHR